jgi:hypothetical protein
LPHELWAEVILSRPRSTADRFCKQFTAERIALLKRSARRCLVSLRSNREPGLDGGLRQNRRDEISVCAVSVMNIGDERSEIGRQLARLN